MDAKTVSWTPQLAPPQSANFRSPNDGFRIRVPRGLSKTHLKRLILEFDGVDVTALMQHRKNTLIFSPPQALSLGDHTLRLVYNAPSGDIEELANWPIEVRRSKSFREAEFQGDLSVNASNRISDKNVDQSVDKAQMDGAFNFAATLADADWKASASADILANTNKTVMNDAQGFDLGSFLFSGEKQNLLGNLGHHGIDHSSLVMQQFFGRGGSATIHNDDQRYQGTVFSMYATPVSGFRNGLGVATDNDSIDGVTAKAFPLKGDPEKLYVSAIYLSGSSSNGQGGEAVIGDTTAFDSDDWGLQAESRVLDKRLRMRAEFARSRFTSKDVGISIPERSDNAYSLLAIYEFQPGENSETPIQWNMGIEHQNIGTDYTSIANVSLPPDRKLWRVFGGFNRGSTDIQASVGRETDNVQGAADLPTVETNQYSLTAGYNPELEFNKEAQPVYGVLGQQSYSLSWFTSRQQQIKDGIGSLADPINQTTRSVNLAGNFSYETWSWGANYNVIMFDDNENINPDTQTQVLDLHSDIMIGERLTIQPQLQWDKTQDLDNTVDTKNFTATLIINYKIVPNKWGLDLNYSLNDSRVSDDSQITRTETIATNLYWQVWPTKPNRPGLQLWLNGSHSDTQDDVTPANSTNSYEVFLGATVGLPVQY